MVQLSMDFNFIKCDSLVFFILYVMDFYGIIFSSFDVFGFFNKPKAASANGFYPNVLVTNMRIKSHPFKSHTEDHFLNVAFELHEDFITPIRQPKFMRFV